MTKELEIEKGIAPDYSYLGLKYIPLHSEILPGLWLGGTDDYDTIDVPITYHDLTHTKRAVNLTNFDVAVTLYAHARPADWHVEEIRYGYMDAGIARVDFEKLGRVVDYAHAAWKSGQRVLIRCQAGLNRSGLTMALLLVKEGYTPQDAINLMRNKRTGYVLCNEEFEQYVLSLGE
jgi:protein-tyrosine phosphatase